MFIVLDLETTGLSAKDDEIIDIALVKINREDFLEVDRYTTFIRPNASIPALISQITNIFDDDVEDAPRFSDISDDVQDFIEGYPIIGHNIIFDIRFLESHGIDTSKNPSIDTFFLANFLCFDEKSLNLWYLCEVFSIPLESAHRALDDTLATVKLFKHLIKKMQDLSYPHTWYLEMLFSCCSDSGVRILRDEYLRDTYKTFSQEEFIASYVSMLKENKPDNSDKNIHYNTVDIDSFLQSIEGFESRESQKIMMDKVDKNFEKWGKLLIEAGTWTWKTFAYLLPAIAHSLRFGEPVHISTSTKALQDQIYYKDLSFLSEKYPQVFSYTKLKGKRNYLSVMNTIDFIDSKDLSSPGVCSFILKIIFWSAFTDFWELDELQFYGEEYSFLSEINAWSSFVFDESNVYRELEFSFRARKRAKAANIIITNNHILFQDIISEGSLLWWVKNLVLDEAHSLEDILTQSLKKTLWFDSIKKLIEKIEKKQQKYHIASDVFSTQRVQCLFDAAELFSIIEWVIFSNFSLTARYKNLLLEYDFFDQNPELSLLSDKVYHTLQVLKQDVVTSHDDAEKWFSQELQELDYMSLFLQSFFGKTDFHENIYYASHDDSKGTLIHSTLLRPWKFLQAHLWNNLESVVLTSATLQMQEDFSYISSMLSLEGFEKFILESDFDYSQQALLFIPNNLWSIKDNIDQTCKFLQEFFHTVWWNTLVLFTAFTFIREVYSQLKIELERSGTHLLAQWVSGSKHKQIDFFKKNSHHSILLGTDTFWEWIDIPWEDLQYLIIHKIPFAVPSDPIFKARSKLVEDSFNDYAIPKAILKLKQWFWRLIRTKSDTWIVVFLDDRITKTRWWERFYDSFPSNIKTRIGNSEKLLDILARK